MQWLIPQSINPKITTRYGHTGSQKNHIVYFYGGCDQNGNLIKGENSLVKFNLSSSDWTILSSHSSNFPPRKYHSSSLLHHRLIIFGLKFYFFIYFKFILFYFILNLFSLFFLFL